MFTKKILFLWLLGVSLLIFWYFLNSGLPLGYDHGAYKHLVNLLEENQNLSELPQYLKHQFEPFSGTFFYVLSTFLGNEFLFGWGYLCIFILTGISLFLLGKKKYTYTLGSYLGLFLFLFSSVQYTNLWWAFGKQIFATFFLILLMRYYKRGFLAFLLIATCISLHRLTGFVALSYFLLSYLSSQKKMMTHYSAIFIGIFVGFLSYLALFYEQVLPYIIGFISHPQKQIFIEGKYGTGFSGRDLFFYVAPVLIMAFSGFMHIYRHKNLKNLFRLPGVTASLLLIIFIACRSIAHTRLGSFLDLFLIITITRYSYSFFREKYIVIFLIIQCIVWGTFVSQWHTPFIDKMEYKIIRDITENMPKNVEIVTLSGSYMSWITGYTHHEIYSPHQGIGQTIWSPIERKNMQNSSGVLCKNLSQISGNIFVYIGAGESYSSLLDNPCLIEAKVWSNGTRLLSYQR